MTNSRIAILRPLLGWCLLAGLVLLSSIPKASTIVFTWPWVFYAQALLVVPVFLVATAAWRSAWRPGITGLCGALLAAAIAVSVILSRQPHSSFEAALPLWGGLAWAFWLAATLLRPKDSPDGFRRVARAAGVVMLIPLTVSAGMYAQELSDLMLAAGTWRIEFTYHRNWYPLGHWNYTGGLALLTLPWLLTLAWSERGRWRALWCGGSLVAAAVFISASSRGAALGALAGAAMAGGLWVAHHRPSRRQLIAAALAALLLGGGLTATNPRLLDLARHPSQIFQPGEGDVQRLGMAQAGWLLGRQRPWVGHGPGMVPFVYPEVRAQLVGGVETSYQLHNGPLHWWATTGAIGLATLGTLLFTGARALWRWRAQPTSDRRRFALASACALVAYAGLALTDYQLDVIAILALLGLHAGTLLSLPPSPGANPGVGRPSPLQHNRWQRAPALSLIAAGLLSLSLLGLHWRARYLHWSALADTPAEERVLLAQRMLRAVDAAPWCSHYRNAAGFQLARASSNAANDPSLRLAARNVLLSSLQIDPAQEPVQAALGWLWLPDDPAPARAHFETALRLLPDRPTTHLGLALACLAQDDRANCVQALAMELLVNPYFVTSPYWNQEPLAEFRDTAYSRWLALADQVLADARLPAWRRPAFVYARAAVRWWREEVAPTPAELAGAAPNQQALFAALATDSASRPKPPQPWLALQQALATPVDASKLLAEALPSLPPTALSNTHLRLPPSGATLATCLRMAIPPEAALTRTTMDREHYSLMHRNLDGPGYADLAPLLDDPFLGYFIASLFPPRSLLPGPIVGDLTSSAL
jgi:O-antigen ligase